MYRVIDVEFTQCAGYPDRAEFRINEVCTTTRVRNLGYNGACNLLPVFGVNHGSLVGFVGSGQEMTVF